MKYYWKMTNLGENGYFNQGKDVFKECFLSTKIETGRYKTQFTIEEFKNRCIKHNLDFEDFEKEEIGKDLR